MTNFEHICSEGECIYLGQPVSRGMCGCYKSHEQLMLAHIEKMTVALQRIASLEVTGGAAANLAERTLAVVSTPKESSNG